MMADLLIDTNVVSYIVKGDSRGLAYGKRLVGHDLYICFATVAELYQWTLQRNWGAHRLAHLQRELQHYTVIGFDDDLAWHWARTRSIPGHPIDPGDAWIAAMALRHNLPLVTHKRRHFEHIPQPDGHLRGGMIHRPGGAPRTSPRLQPRLPRAHNASCVPMNTPKPLHPPPGKLEPVKQILDDLEPIIRRCAVGKMQTDGAFLVCVRAALAKNFEVNRFLQSKEAQQNAFAVTSALRGICEDIIVLKWLGTFTRRDRDEAVGVLMMKNVLEFMQQQTAFFSKYRPSQPILEAKDVSGEIQGLKQRLRGFRKRYKWKKHREWPSIREMAAAGDLLPLYDFVYAGTTSFVHFSPNNLIRMGKLSSGEKMSFSTANFSEYYNAFNRFYGIFLFVTFCTTFAKALGCADEIRPAIEKLMRHIDEELRWPELVTTEEMNVPAVSQMLRLMAHKARKFAAAASVWKWHELS